MGCATRIRQPGGFSMGEAAFFLSGDAEAAAAMGIGASDLGVGADPVVGIRGALFRGQQRQKGSKGIHRDPRAGVENQRFAFDAKAFAFDMAADRGPAIQHGFDLQVVKPEVASHVAPGVAPVVGHVPPSAGSFQRSILSGPRYPMWRGSQGPFARMCETDRIDMHNPDRPDRLRLSDRLEISRVVTGLWQVADIEKGGDVIDPETGADWLEAYAAQGFDTFDMADHYGSAEIIAGRLLARQRSLRPLVFTKWCPEPGPMTRDVVRAGVLDRLTRLGVDRVDLLQFHWWSFMHPAWLDALHCLAELREDGLISEIGITNFDAAHLRVALSDGIPVLTNQVSFSLIDRRATCQLSDLCAATDTKLLAYGTLCGGFLSERWLGQPEPAVIPDWSKMKYSRFIEVAGGWDRFQCILTAAHSIGQKHGVSLSNVATRWVLEHPAVAGAIVGARLGERVHADDNLKLFSFALDDEDHQKLKGAFADTNPVPGDCGDEYRQLPFLTASGDLSHHLEAMPLPYNATETLHRAGGRQVVSGSKWEDIAGYARAQKVGNRVFVSGTTATAGADRVVAKDDAGAQTTYAIDKILAALEALGATAKDVVRTRIYIVDEADVEAISRAHGQYFGAIKPANTLIVVSGLIGGYRVEIEAEAVIRESPASQSIKT